ncbi:hypothetical protein CEXT_433361 [Caerostris extrusa]|uniref:Uncharacterized protein n=1 Tax=Caerostris extrusa TaxID=172846 RepID=A0AAV4UW58_CAEEX|nr:hypothetical protein CEXT_433361 [Caerostris extrusa]
MHTAEQNRMPNPYFQAANKNTRDCTSWRITAYNIMVQNQESLPVTSNALPPSQCRIHTETTRILFESRFFYLVLFFYHGAFFLAIFRLTRNQFRTEKRKRFHFEFFLKVLNLQKFREASSSLEGRSFFTLSSNDVRQRYSVRTPFFFLIRCYSSFPLRS